MSYKVTVIADFYGRLYIGADKRQAALAKASPIAEVKLYSSQLPFVVSARMADGRVTITTKTAARRHGWTILQDMHKNLYREFRETLPLGGAITTKTTQGATTQNTFTDSPDPSLDPEVELGQRQGEAAKKPGTRALLLFYCRKAAERGDPEAQTKMGDLYYRGNLVAKDESQALHWYRLAAEQGSIKAQRRLGRLEADASWYLKAAERGDAKTQQVLGLMFYFGRLVTKDQEEAVTWFRRAAEQGDAKAQRWLGDLYRWGTGVAQDPLQAALWYLKAATQGDAKAQEGLGDLYFWGQGVPENKVFADWWYRRASGRGHSSLTASIHTNSASMHDSVARNTTAPGHSPGARVQHREAGAQQNLSACYQTIIGCAHYENSLRALQRSIACWRVAHLCRPSVEFFVSALINRWGPFGISARYDNGVHSLEAYDANYARITFCISVYEFFESAAWKCIPEYLSQSDGFVRSLSDYINGPKRDGEAEDCYTKRWNDFRSSAYELVKVGRLAVYLEEHEWACQTEASSEHCAFLSSLIDHPAFCGDVDLCCATIWNLLARVSSGELADIQDLKKEAGRLTAS